MLRHSQKKDQAVKITLPDGTHGFVSTDRRCHVSYDFPAHVKIELQPSLAEQQRSEQNCLIDKEVLATKGRIAECYPVEGIIRVKS